MDRDPGAYVGLIAVASGAVILAMSYLGAYLIGRSHGRRSEERSLRRFDQDDSAQRICAIESTMHGLSSSIERLMDAQRLLVAQQEHLSRKIGLGDRNNVGLPAAKSHHTPS
jgi:hypothetical protein